MTQCRSIGCISHDVIFDEEEDFCPACSNKLYIEAKSYGFIADQPESVPTSVGGDNDYWLVDIPNPKRLEPYTVECEDIIEALNMTFQEGEAIKAVFRKCKARMGDGKPDDTPLRNAQKVAHYGTRMVAMEERELECAS
jgi:hypothetical protein